MKYLKFLFKSIHKFIRLTLNNLFQNIKIIEVSNSKFQVHNRNKIKEYESIPPLIQIANGNEISNSKAKHISEKKLNLQKVMTRGEPLTQ